jgi:flavin-dependent dehydrogenase
LGTEDFLAAATSIADPIDCDVLVIGGGPAGSTIAALLTERGKSVTLIDKDKHPRFHIGESLLPFNLPLFERLGVGDQIKKIGMPKFGIEFVSPDRDKPNLLEFGEGWRKEMDLAYQVRRSEFDHILLRNAEAKGAKVIEETRVNEVEFLPDGGAVATAVANDGSIGSVRARFVVDATGRDTFLANRMKLKQRNRRHESAAIYGHFTGAERLAGREEGNISIFWFAKGWFWFIPLVDGTTSVGAVCKPEHLKNRGSDLNSYFQELIDSCPVLASRLSKAEMVGPATATGNYSYQTEKHSGDGFILIGDASAFIDPVFSTGVYLAMKSAFAGADAVVACLDHPKQAQQALAQFEREVRKGLGSFTWFIYRMTSPTIRNLFMASRAPFQMKEAVLTLLAGDVALALPVRLRLQTFKALYYANTAIAAVAGIFSRPSPAQSRAP